MATGDKFNMPTWQQVEEIRNLLLPEEVWGFIEHNATLQASSRIEYIGINKNYTPVKRNGNGVALNSWSDFPLIKANKPYMVKADGTADYMLNENDYTKKADGTASDISNQDYNGGAFSWIQKIYKHEHMEGNDRVVMFSMVERPGYKPIGFVDSAKNELNGIWLPMFYASVVGTKAACIAGTQPDYSKTTDAQNNALKARGDRWKFFAGPIVETLIDLMMMWAKTTDVRTVFGYGNCTGYKNEAPTYGVLKNAVVGGGQFYATSDKKSLNKFLHSIVPISFQQWMRDPYEIVVNGRVKVSTDYSYDVSGASYLDTGINIPNGSGWMYPLRYITVSGYGSIPGIILNGGSTSTGVCAGTYIPDNQTSLTVVSLRFADCSAGDRCHPRTRIWNASAGVAYWGSGFAPVLLPPVGAAA